MFSDVILVAFHEEEGVVDGSVEKNDLIINYFLYRLTREHVLAGSCKIKKLLALMRTETHESEVCDLNLLLRFSQVVATNKRT